MSFRLLAALSSMPAQSSASACSTTGANRCSNAQGSASLGAARHRVVLARALQRRLDPDGVVDPRRHGRGSPAANGGESRQHLTERQSISIQPPVKQRPVATGATTGTTRPAAAQPDRHRPSGPARVRNRRTGVRRWWRPERSDAQKKHPRASPTKSLCAVTIKLWPSWAWRLITRMRLYMTRTAWCTGASAAR